MQNQSQLRGIKGWLLLLVIKMIFITPVFLILFEYSSFYTQELSNPQLTNVILWKSLKKYAMLSSFIFSIVSIYGGYKLYSGKNKESVTSAIFSLWVSGVGFSLSIMLILKSHLDYVDVDYLFKSFFAAILHATAWTLYLKKSKRVENTYSFYKNADMSKSETRVERKGLHASSSQMKQQCVMNNKEGTTRNDACSEFISTRTNVSIKKEVNMDQARISIDEDAIYESIADELDSGSVSKGLWTKLFAKYDGDEVKIKAEYIRQRFSKLQKDAIQAEKNKHQTILKSNVHIINRASDESELEIENSDLNGSIDNDLKSLISDYKKSIDHDKAVRIAEDLGYNVSSTMRIGSKCISVKSPYGQVFYFNSDSEFQNYVLNSLC